MNECENTGWHKKLAQLVAKDKILSKNLTLRYAYNEISHIGTLKTLSATKNQGRSQEFHLGAV